MHTNENVVPFRVQTKRNGRRTAYAHVFKKQVRRMNRQSDHLGGDNYGNSKKTNPSG